MSIKRGLIAVIAGGSFTLLAACGSTASPAASSSTSTVASSSSAASTAMSSSSSTAMAGGMVGAGCAGYAAANPSGAGSIDGMAAAKLSQAASGNPLLTTLVAAVSGKLNPKVNLVPTLDGGEFTVFAPVDDAFKGDVDAATLDALKTNDALLTSILTYHVIAGQIAPDAIVGTHKTVEGEDVTVSGSGDNLMVNGMATVVCGGVKTANATVYLVDHVLIPPTIAAAQSSMMSTASMTAGATGASLVGPGCAAYAAANPTGAGSVEGMATAKLSQAASGNPLLTTLVKAVAGQLNPKVNLVTTLDGAEFTVFAPVDSAFAKLDAATVAKLGTDSALLTDILTYHVISGQISPDAIAGKHTTVEGKSLEVTGSGDSLMVNGSAAVVCGGVKTANATVYLIDSVLTPPAA